MKTRRRYCLIRLLYSSAAGKDIWSVVAETYRRLFGDVDYAVSDIYLVEEGSGWVIVRIRYDRVDRLRVSVASSGLDGIPYVERVSGTLRALKEKAGLLSKNSTGPGC